MKLITILLGIITIGIGAYLLYIYFNIPTYMLSFYERTSDLYISIAVIIVGIAILYIGIKQD